MAIGAFLRTKRDVKIETDWSFRLEIGHGHAHGHERQSGEAPAAPIASAIPWFDIDCAIPVSIE